MGILRLNPQKDAWITNRTIGNGKTASDCNLGANPTLQIYKMTGSIGSGVARSLIQFDIAYLSGAIAAGTVPSSSVYFLRANNYFINESAPSSFDMEALPIVGQWDQGIGVDDKLWQDFSYCSWNNATSTRAWTSGGADFTRAYGSASQHFDAGTENFEVDVTPIVRAWLTGALDNNGFVLKLTDTCEQNNVNYYRKVFYAQETKYVANIPYLEARWEDSLKDNRGNVAFGQPSNLMLYNFARGQLRNLTNENVSVKVQDNIIGNSCSFQSTYAAKRLSEGVYNITLNIQKTGSTQFSASWNDIWFDDSGTLLMSGTFRPLVLTGSQTDPYFDFTCQPDYKRFYRCDELAHVKVPVTIDNHNDYLARHTASLNGPIQYLEDLHFSVINHDSNEVVIPFGTGSVQYTRTSYNAEGNYFNLQMRSLVSGFLYRFAFLVNFNKYEKTILDDGQYVFKVE